jgi:hypothetical protein
VGGRERTAVGIVARGRTAREASSWEPVTVRLCERSSVL